MTYTVCAFDLQPIADEMDKLVKECREYEAKLRGMLVNGRADEIKRCADAIERVLGRKGES